MLARQTTPPPPHGPWTHYLSLYGHRKKSLYRKKKVMKLFVANCVRTLASVWHLPLEHVYVPYAIAQLYFGCRRMFHLFLLLLCHVV